MGPVCFYSHIEETEYSLMLKEPNSDNQEFDGEDLETLTGQIISKIIVSTTELVTAVLFMMYFIKREEINVE